MRGKPAFSPNLQHFPAFLYLVINAGLLILVRYLSSPSPYVTFEKLVNGLSMMVRGYAAQISRVPAAEPTAEDRLLYRHTGIHEPALTTDDIEAFFANTKAASLRLQTDYIWSCENMGRSFIFYDPEGNMIQMWQP